MKDEVSEEATVEVEEKEKVKNEVNEDKTPEVFTDVDKTENLTINKANQPDNCEESHENSYNVAEEEANHDTNTVDDPEKSVEKIASDVEEKVATDENSEKKNEVIEYLEVGDTEDMKNIDINADKQKEAMSPIVTIFAVAKFENSNSNQISTVEFSALSNILKSKDHLCRNISNVNFRNLQTYRVRAGKFDHSIQLELSVNTANL